MVTSTIKVRDFLLSCILPSIPESASLPLLSSPQSPPLSSLFYLSHFGSLSNRARALSLSLSSFGRNK